MHREGLSYKLGPDGELINHLLFVDDLKLYARSEDQLDNLVMLVGLYLQDMQLGVNKCAVLTLKREVRARCEDIGLPDGEVMKEVDEGQYRYLGLLEGADIRNREMKEKIRTEYLR